VTPMAMYAEGLRAAAAGRTDVWVLRHADGSAEPLALGRWCGSLVAGDHGLLRQCTGPTVDLGCGPGRLTAALAWQGLPVLGVDVSHAAVALARARGVSVLRRSVFDRLPAEGRWQAALLADGNVGIGGDPVRLLTRVRSLLEPRGVILCELDPPDAVTKAVKVRIENPVGLRTGEFGWAHLSVSDISTVAAIARLAEVDTWDEAGRWFSVLAR